MAKKDAQEKDGTEPLLREIAVALSDLTTEVRLLREAAELIAVELGSR